MNFIKKHGKKIVAPLLFIIAVSVAVLLYFDMQRTAQEIAADLPKPEPTLVDVLAVSVSEQSSVLNYIGIIEPSELSQINVSTVGTVTEIYVDEGDAVVEGQAIIELDKTSAQSQVDVATQLLSTAKAVEEGVIAEKNTAEAAYNASLELPTQQEIDIAKSDADLAYSEWQLTIEKTAAAQAEYDLALKDKEAAEAALKTANDEIAAAQKVLDDAKAEQAALPDTATEEEKTAAQNKVDAAEITLADTEAKHDITALSAEVTKTSEEETAKQATLLLAQREELTAEADYITKNLYYEQLTSSDGTTVDSDAALLRLRTAETALAEAQSSVLTAEATLTNAEKALADLTIRAPISGTVAAVIATEGSVATPIAPVMAIIGNGRVVSFGVSPTDLPLVTVGTPVTVTLPDSSPIITVKNVATMPDEQSRTYSATAELPSELSGAPIGDTVKLTVHIGDRGGVWLPINVLLNDGEDYVFVVEDGRAVKKRITIVDIVNDYVSVEGLTEGELVISTGMKLVRSGDEVEVIVS